MKEKCVPSLRFKGFSEEWVEKTFQDFATVLMNKRVFKFQTSESGDIPFFKIGTFGGIADSYISKELFLSYKEKYPYPNKGDVLLSASGSIGKIVEYQGEDAYFQDSNIIWLEHKGTLENIFLKYLYFIIKWEGLEGSTIKRLYNKNILETKLIIPRKSEQTKIGNYFKNLDELINLNQAKYDKLQNAKKALLEKIFPKENSLVPELRFKGFNGEWEEDLLENLGTYNKGNGYSKADLKDYGSPIILYGRLYINHEIVIKEISTFVHHKHGTVWSNGNEVIIPASGETSDDIARASVILNAGIVIGGDLNIITPDKKIDSTFLALSISHGVLKKELSKKAQGKSVVHIRNKDIQSCFLWFPHHTEQTKISNLFQKLDKLINLQETKIQKLQNIKKACLAKMFV